MHADLKALKSYEWVVTNKLMLQFINSSTMDENKIARKPANSYARCRNCSLKVPTTSLKNQRSLRDATLFMKDVLQSWIAPTPVLPDDDLCKECFLMLQELPEEKRPPAPMLGNRFVCFGCGTSFLHTRAHTVDLKSPLRSFLIKHIPAHLVHRLTRVCYRCWHHALIEMRRSESFDSSRLLVETSGPENKDETIPLKQLIVPVRVEAKPVRRSSSTESIDSEELENFVSTYKLKRRNSQRRQDKVKGYSGQRRPLQKSELEMSSQYRYEKVSAYTTVEIRRMVYRVFRFLHYEYKCMKARTRGTCDISPLANVVKRTATATGVSQDAVRKIVRDAETINSNKKPLKIVRRVYSPAAQLVAQDHCYYLSPQRQIAHYTTVSVSPKTCLRDSPPSQEDPSEPIEDDDPKLILKCEVFDEGIQQSQPTVHQVPPDVKVEADVKVEPEEYQYEQPVQECIWNNSSPSKLIWARGGSCRITAIRPGLLEDYPEETGFLLSSVPANTFEPLENYPEEIKSQVTSVPGKNIFEQTENCLEETKVQVTSVPANTFDMECIKCVKDVRKSIVWPEGKRPKRRTRQRPRLSA